MSNEKNFLENRTVILKPIVKPGGMNPKGHDGEFMYSGTQLRFVLPYNVRKGRLESILTQEEQEFFEKRLNADLNIHNKVDNFWFSFDVLIRKDDKLMQDGYRLDLNDPVDNLRYRLLKIQPTIAPSWAERFNRGEYRLALVDENELSEERSKKADLKKEAYMFLGKVEGSKKKMVDFLRVYGKHPAENASIEFLKGEIDKIIDNPKTLKSMISIIHDPNYEMKLFIEDAIECGAIKRKNRKYYLPGGDPLNANDPSLDGTVGVLNEYKKEADDIILKIEAQINTCKNKK